MVLYCSYKTLKDTFIAAIAKAIKNKDVLVACDELGSVLAGEA